MPQYPDEDDEGNQSIKFCAHIIQFRWSKDDIQDEYHVVRSVNLKQKPVVSCFIPAQPGWFFKCRFSYEGAAHDSFPFSGLFVRDDKVIARAVVLDAADMAAEIRGRQDDQGKTWYMQFQSLCAAGALFAVHFG